MFGRYRDLRRKYPNIGFFEYDYDHDKEAVLAYGVGKTLPVLILFKDDAEAARFIGEKSLKEIAEKIENIKNAQ
jgi:thiol-disulfide isomerase/thioredoxin